MKKWNMFIVVTLLTMLFALMSACSESSKEDASNQSESDTIPASTDDSNDSSTESAVESDKNEENQVEESSMEDSNAQVDSSEEDHTPLPKVAGRTEYLNKLDNIQKELNAMPDKKVSDKGVTNAMKNYYGVSYERYDDALNEIYSLLKKELSPEVMKELKAEQLKWIEQKEAKAEKERLKYEGGTFENVAWYISLYESTKDRCYELVNEYMTD
ncbi:lysozyme inhibitor LprI family protein [Rossellomorea aquimaris]|uniref:lysozyme inhibitor LprI family protein n=1 Tax=Rossellomorea aquimaris TaxID=189382 RepID=UPI0037C6FA8A